MRAQVSRWVAIYAFCIVAASLYVGAYVLSFFGISIPVLRVAGGIVVAMSGWRMLNEPDATEQRRSEAPAYPRSIDTPPSRLAFYPLTMPLTTGPGTISVAISLGASRPARRFTPSLIAFFSRDAGRRRCCSRCWCTGSTATPARLADLIGRDRHHHHRAAVRVSAVLHRHPGVLERRRRSSSAACLWYPFRVISGRPAATKSSDRPAADLRPLSGRRGLRYGSTPCAFRYSS